MQLCPSAAAFCQDQQPGKEVPSARWHCCVFFRGSPFFILLSMGTNNRKYTAAILWGQVLVHSEGNSRLGKEDSYLGWAFDFLVNVTVVQ